MPATEAAVGITETLGVHREFRAVVKQIVEDFVVCEVLQDGSEAKLTQLPVNNKRKRPSTDSLISDTTSRCGDSNPAYGPVHIISDDEFAALDKLFPDGNTAASQSLRLLMTQSSSMDPVKKPALLPPCQDKSTRTAIHEWIAAHMPTFISDTIDAAEGKVVRVRLASNVRPSKRRRSDRERLDLFHVPPHIERAQGESTESDVAKTKNSMHLEGKLSLPCPLPRGTPVQFVLWKRGLDTNHALSILGKYLRVPPGAFSYAGTKDKRGITTQLVQVRGVQERSFAHANAMLTPHNGRQRTLAVGNLSISPRRTLKLGDLRGNRFTVVLRDVDISEHDAENNIRRAVDSLSTYGFVNYFGLQRFGSGMSPTHETGFAVMRGDFRDVCYRLLRPLVIDCTGEELRSERSEMQEALSKFAHGGLSATELLKYLPTRMTVERTIAESFARNERNQQKHDYRAAFGQLPRNLRRIYPHAVQSFLWNMMASERIRRLKPNHEGRLHAIAGDLVLEEATIKNSCEDLNHETKVRSVSKEEEEARSVSVYDVLIPVAGSHVAVPQTSYGALATKILEEQKVDLQNQVTTEYDVKGTYRKLIARPSRVAMDFMSYKNHSLPLVPTGLELSNLNQDSSVMVEAASDTPTHRSHSAGIDATVEVNDNCDTSVVNKCADEREKTALVMSFTLGCAEYATMLVRELTKCDSSKEGQKALQLSDSVVNDEINGASKP